MRKEITLIATMFIGAAMVQAQDLPQPSPHAEVEQIIGLTQVEVEYSRPSVKGREIFGSLVPYGEMWRTGANKNTMIEFDGPMVIEGTTVPGGKYSIFTIPTAASWTVILNKGIEHSGTDGYDKEMDVLRVDVKPATCEMTETMTFVFANVVDDKARLDLVWNKTRISLNLHADASEKAIVNIKEAIAKDDADFGTFNRSARYCVDKGIMLEQALEWSTKSVSMEKKFWNLHTLALAQAANGMKKEAIATANESMKLAQEAEYAPYVKLNKEKIEEWSKK